MLNSIPPTIDQLLVFDSEDRRTTYPTPDTAITFSTLDDHTRVDSFDGTKIITSYKNVEITYNGPIQMTPAGPLPIALFGIHDSSVKITVRVHGLLDRVIKGAIIHSIPPGSATNCPISCPNAVMSHPKHVQLVGVEALANGSQSCIAYHLYGTNPIDATRRTPRFVFRCAVPLCPFGRMDVYDHETITYESREAFGAYDKRLLGQLAVCRAFQRQHLAKGYVHAITSLRPIANVMAITYPDEPPILFVASSSSHVEHGSIHSLSVSLPNLGIKAVYPHIPMDNLLMRISVASPKAWLLHNAKAGVYDFGPVVSDTLLQSLRDCKFIIEMPRDFMVLATPFAKLVKGVVVNQTSMTKHNLLQGLCKCTCLSTLNLSPKLRLNFTIQHVDFPHLTNLSAAGGLKITPEVAQQLEVIALPLGSLMQSGIHKLDNATTLRITERTERELLHWTFTQTVIYSNPMRTTSGRISNLYKPTFRGKLDVIRGMPNSMLYQWMRLLWAPQLKQFGVHELLEDAKLLMHPLVRNCELLTIAHLGIFDAIMLTDYLKQPEVRCNLCLETLPEAWRLDELRVVNLYTHPSVISFQATPVKEIMAEVKAKNLSVEKFLYDPGWRSTDMPWSLDEASEINQVTNIPKSSDESVLVFAHKTFAARWPEHYAELSFPLASNVVDLAVTSYATTLNDVSFIASAIYTLTLRAELLMISTDVPVFSRVSTLTIFVDDDLAFFNNPSYVTNYFPEVLRISFVVELVVWKRMRTVADISVRIKGFMDELQAGARRTLTTEVAVTGSSQTNQLMEL